MFILERTKWSSFKAFIQCPAHRHWRRRDVQVKGLISLSPIIRIYNFSKTSLKRKIFFLYSCTFASLCLTFHLQDNKDSHMCCAAAWCEGLYLRHFAQQFVLLLWTFSALFSFIFFSRSWKQGFLYWYLKKKKGPVLLKRNPINQMISYEQHLSTVVRKNSLLAGIDLTEEQPVGSEENCLGILENAPQPKLLTA